MTNLKEFEYYLSNEIIRKVSQDKPRAEFLLKESETSLIGLKERVKIMKINEFNANSIVKDCYDIIMEIIRAKMLLEGYSASGSHSHEGEVSYLKNKNITDNEIIFINELRYFRNSVNYYGKILDKEYAKKVFDFTEKVVPKLKNIV